MMYIYLALFCVLVLILWLAPLFKPVRPSLPVLWFPHVGVPLAYAKHKNAYLSYKRLEKLLARLVRKQFTAILPSQVKDGKLPANPVLLVFDGGYQTFYTHVFPLLEKYNLRAAVTIPVGLIGQYDAWNPNGPWQNLLTAEQIQTLHKSKRVEFISAGLDHNDLNSLPEEKAIWQLQESKFRFTRMYHLPLGAYFFNAVALSNPAVLLAAKQTYSLLFNPAVGNNCWPVDAAAVLRVFPLKKYTFLSRLCWKLRRP